MKLVNEYLELVKNNFEYEKDDVLDIDGYKRYSDDIDMGREDLVKKYAWAIPNRVAVESVADNDPIVEIGSGSGYWSDLIDQVGGDIIAFDNNERQYEKNWFNVKYGDAEVAGKYSDRTMFICWPDYHNKMGEIAVENYDGECIILVGEPISGCTGTAEMYRMIESDYELDKTVDIPNWFGIKDRMYIYKS